MGKKQSKPLYALQMMIGLGLMVLINIPYIIPFTKTICMVLIALFTIVTIYNSNLELYA